MGSINVCVEVLLSSPPSETDMDGMRLAASQASDAKGQVSVYAHDTRENTLVTEFTIDANGWVGVADRIWRAFTDHMRSFEDATIRFPRRGE